MFWTSSALLKYLTSPTSDYLVKSVWPDGFIELYLLISSFSNDEDDVYDGNEDDHNDGRKRAMKNDNKTPYVLRLT